MKKYNRVMLGKGSMYVFENWRDFNEKFIPVWMDNVPGKSKTSAGLACGFLWTSSKVDSAQKWVHPDIVGVQFEEFKRAGELL